MAWERPRADERRERGVRRALVLSLIAHAVLLSAFVMWVRPPEILPAPPDVVEIDLAPPPQASASATPAAPSASASAAHASAHAHASAAAPATPGASASSVADSASAPAPAPSSTPRRTRDGFIVVAPGIEGLVGEEFRREREANGEAPADPAARGARTRKPGTTVSDQLDGIADLGSGEPGDPRIPGAGPVDIAEVLSRDAVVATSRERVAEGQMHPFLCDVKARIESEWDPGPRDAALLSNPQNVYDPVCAAGYHKRFKVARVLAVYDATGARIRFTIAGSPLGRDLQGRVKKAVDDAGMHAPPRELLDDEGHLRLAWNVFLDDYTGCNLVGTDARGKHAYGMSYIVGVVELEGMF